MLPEGLRGRRIETPHDGRREQSHRRRTAIDQNRLPRRDLWTDTTKLHGLGALQNTPHEGGANGEQQDLMLHRLRPPYQADRDPESTSPKQPPETGSGIPSRYAVEEHSEGRP